MGVYYNENDPKAAAWLRLLITAGLIAPGEVDERSITDVEPDELAGFSQCHFFAGIGGWSYALRLAGIPDTHEIWTGSCPCQPFSVGNVWQGGGLGRQDARHLWPSWIRLIRKRRPATLFGEQVADAIRKHWLDEVCCDLEAFGYACGTAVIPACAVGARHIRKRLFWCAYAGSEGRQGHQSVTSILEPTATTLPINGDPLARAWSAVDGDLRDLLHCDGLSVQLERDAIKGYGNAIVPQAAAEFIQACEEARAELT